MKLQLKVSKDRAIPRLKKYHYFSMAYFYVRKTTEARWRPPFLPGGKICRLLPVKPVSVIA
jgi:hypothetical protein